MSKIVVIGKNGSGIYPSFSEFFTKLVDEGKFVKSVKDGIIETVDGEKIEYGFLSTVGTKDAFVNEISEYRDELRASVAKLKKGGIGIPKEELDKLVAQFEFLGKGK